MIPFFVAILVEMGEDYEAPGNDDSGNSSSSVYFGISSLLLLGTKNILTWRFIILTHLHNFEVFSFILRLKEEREIDSFAAISN